jgi:Nucleotidyl transferase AbiEii toxin, Type IV TA system
VFKRVHHRAVAELLTYFNADFLAEAQCFFGGGTAIVLALGEYRESLDIDFLCASKTGFRALRNTVTEQSLGEILKTPVSYVRAVRSDLYGIRTFVEVQSRQIKIELVNEARIELSGGVLPLFGVPTLSRTDMYAEKLLANADRGSDPSVFSRDMIDLLMLIDAWGDIPSTAWQKVRDAYGASVDRSFRDSLTRIKDDAHLELCLRRMHMDLALHSRIQAVAQRCGATR